ncbi:MAG TPA: hypothetical protein PLP19_17160 [bacterium]|nr:hypothetical protein [bacterium]HPN45224.1 hypothetical protein [bacterium]
MKAILEKNIFSYFPVVICILLFCIPVPLIIAFEIYVIFFIVIFTIYRSYDKEFKLVIFISACFRFILIVVDESVMPILPEQTDSILYDTAASQILDNCANHLSLFYRVESVTNIRSYGFIISLLYNVFGEYFIIPRIANALLGILVAILVYKICFKLFNDRKAAFISMNLVLFWPSILVFNSYALRDTLISLLTFLMLHKLVLISLKEKIIKSIFYIILILIIMFFFRSQNVFLYFGIFTLFTIIILFRANIKVANKIFLLLFMSIILLFIFYKLSPLIIEVATYPFRAHPGRVEGGSAYLQNMVYNNYLDIFLYLPIRFFYFTFGPFLWNFKTMFQLLSAIEGIFIFICFILFIKHFFKSHQKRLSNIEVFLFIFCMTGLFANAMIDSNFGTAIRHRIDYIIIFFIFTGIYLKNFKIKII